MHTLYIVPTPIGNLEDITLRALSVLRSCDVIYCEDTRHSRHLLTHYDIHKELVSYHKHNEKSRVEEIRNRLLEGQDVAVVSDAGTPGISDPVGVLVRALSEEEGITITVLPGATAFVPAVVQASFDAPAFMFLGFLPDKRGARNDVLASLSQLASTLVIYASPHSMRDVLSSIYEVLGDRRIVLVREISKIYEEVLRGQVAQFLERDSWRGEFVVCVEGAREVAQEDFRDFAWELFQKGVRHKDVANVLKQDPRFRNVQKNEVYEYILQRKEQGDA